MPCLTGAGAAAAVEEQQPLAGGLAIGYVTSRFPHFSETFIVREMDAVVAAGHPVTLYPLLRQRQRVVHPAARAWLAAARWTEQPLAVLASHVWFLRRRPRTYLATGWRVLRAHGSSPVSLAHAALVFAEAVHIARRARLDGVEHVHAHYATHPALAAWIVHRLTGLPYTVTVHAHDIFLPGRMLEDKLGDAACVVTVSDFNRRRVGELVSSSRRVRTATVHCGVDPARYAADGNRLRSRRRSTAPPRLLSVGSLQEYKGHRHLVAACRLLRQRGVEVSLTIVGDGRLRPDLERQVRDDDLGDVVQLLGVQDEDAVAELLRSADCYLQPSVVAANGQMEGIPVALMEAMAGGVPVVATALSGVRELVRQGRTGWLVPPADATALADAVEDVLRRPDLVASRTAAARELVVAQFNVSTSARQLSEVFLRARTGDESVPAGRRRAVAS